MLALPLQSAEAGPMKDLVKKSLGINALFAKKAAEDTARAVKGAAKLTKQSLKFNAKMAKCAVDIALKKAC